MDTETAREEILAGAAKLFMERGYDATSVREIGEHLDISQSSLYYHAKNKAQILVDLNKGFMSRLVDAFEAIDAIDAPATEKLSRVMHELLQAISDNQEVVAVVLHERRSLPAAAARSIQRQRDRVDAVIDRIIDRGVAEGSFREVDAVTVRLALTGMTNWAYTWYRPDGGKSAQEIADGFVDILLRGIQAS
jgi:AcrR family transcriptional regulator